MADRRSHEDHPGNGNGNGNAAGHAGTPEDRGHSGKAGGPWYQRAYEAFREWVDDDPTDAEAIPADVEEAADPVGFDQFVETDPEQGVTGASMIEDEDALLEAEVDLDSVGFPAVELGSAGSVDPVVVDQFVETDPARIVRSQTEIDEQPALREAGAPPDTEQVPNDESALVEAVAPVLVDQLVETDPALIERAQPEIGEQPALCEDDAPADTEQVPADESALVEAVAPVVVDRFVETDPARIVRSQTEIDEQPAFREAGAPPDTEQVPNDESTLVEAVAPVVVDQFVETNPARIVRAQPDVDEDAGAGPVLIEAGHSLVDETEAARREDVAAADGEETPELIEGEPAAQTAPQETSEREEAPPPGEQYVSDPLLQAAATLTDPVAIGAAAPRPVGGLTQTDQEMPDQRQSLSAEGADGTSSALDSGGGGGRGYEPPSAWDKFVQANRPDNDQDDDGVLDGLQDSDGDGLSDAEERWSHDTDPHNADTDGDGVKDGAEITAGTDPTAKPLPLDSDGDGLSDAIEIGLGYDPKSSDTDGDGLTDNEEFLAGSDARNKDTDGDGLTDYEEEREYGTNPLKKDTDDDGLSDRHEVRWDFDPNDSDMDDDSLKDGFEIKHGTDPNNANTDGKGPDDGLEDDDLDGLTAADEQASGTDPNDAYTRGGRHDRTGLTLDEAADGLNAGRVEIREADAAREAADVAAGDRYRWVAEGDAPYVYEGSNLYAKYRAAVGTAHVTETATGNSIPITDVPRGAAIRTLNEDEIAELKANQNKIEDGREELPTDERGPIERAIDYMNKVRPDPAETDEKGPPAGEFETGGFDGEGEDENAPDSVDINDMTLEREVPVVDGARLDPSRLLAGDVDQDPTAGSVVGADPFGPGSSPPPEDDRNPVGKAVDPEEVAAQVGRSTPTDSTGSSGSGSSDPFSGRSGAGMTDADLIGESVTNSPFDRVDGDSGNSGGSPSAADPGASPSTDTSAGGPADEVQSYETDDDGNVDASQNADYQRGEDGNWYDSKSGNAADAETAASLDQTEAAAEDGGDSGDGGDGDGGGDSPNFGGGLDVDRGALLDAVGRRERGAGMGTDMKPTPGPSEQGTVRESTPVARIPISDPYGTAYKDMDGDGVSDWQEERDGTDATNPGSFRDSDGDGIPDATDLYYDESAEPEETDDETTSGTEDADGVSPGDPTPPTDENSRTDNADGVSTSGDPLGGGIVDRAKAEEALQGVGAPQNGAQPQPIDPNPWEGTIEEGTIVGEIITSDDLAQPVPDEGAGHEGARETPTTDAGATGGRFGSGVIDPANDDDTVPQGDGPWADTPDIIDVDATHDSESTQEAPLQEVELGTVLEATPATGPNAPSGEHNYLGEPVGSSAETDDSVEAGPQPVGPDPAEGIDDEFVGRLELSLATTGPNDAPLTQHLDDSGAPDDDTGGGFGTGDSESVIPATSGSSTDDGFGNGDLDRAPSDSGPVPPPAQEIFIADELDGISAEKAEALGLPEDEPPIDLGAEEAKSDAAPLPDDDIPIDEHDFERADLLDR